MKRQKKMWVLLLAQEGYDIRVLGIFSSGRKARFAAGEFNAFEGFPMSAMSWEGHIIDRIGAVLRVKVAGL